MVQKTQINKIKVRKISKVLYSTSLSKQGENGADI
jgi:hypothetical protein